MPNTIILTVVNTPYLLIDGFYSEMYVYSPLFCLQTTRDDMLRSIIVDRWRTCCFALSSSSLSAATAADDDDADSVIIHRRHHCYRDDDEAARVLKRCASKEGGQQQSTCAMALLSHAINGHFRDCVVVVAVVSILWLWLVVEVASSCSAVASWCCGCTVVAAVVP